MKRGTKTTIGLLVGAALMAAGCSSSSAGGRSAPPPQQAFNVNLSGMPTGRILCVGPGLEVYRTPDGQQYTDPVIGFGYWVRRGARCSPVAIWRTKQGQLVYRARDAQLDFVPVQPLVTDTTAGSTADMYLTQDLKRVLRPGVTRFVDTTAVEPDPSGYHLLAGFPTAAQRFYDYYAGVSVAGGQVQICLPSYNQMGSLGQGNNHPDNIHVHVLLNRQDCQLPPAAGLPGKVTPLTKLPVGETVFGECSNLARDPKGNYFDLTSVPRVENSAYWREVGMPGYGGWPLHVQITRTPTEYRVVVINEGSCVPYEPPIVPIHRA